MGEPGKIASLHHGREELEYTKTFSAFDFLVARVNSRLLPCFFGPLSSHFLLGCAPADCNSFHLTASASIHTPLFLF